MLVSSERLKNCSVASLHLGGIIAKTTSLIVDPNTLKIIGFTLSGPAIKGETGNILRVEDVREFGRYGLIVDSTDEFVFRKDVIKIDQILNLNFNLEGMDVVTKKGKKLGKVISYIVEINSFQILQLIVKRPIFKSFMDPELTIPRSEIIEIDDYKITIKDDEKKIKEKAADEPFVPNFINPFRETPEPQPAPLDTKTPAEPNN